MEPPGRRGRSPRCTGAGRAILPAADCRGKATSTRRPAPAAPAATIRGPGDRARRRTASAATPRRRARWRDAPCRARSRWSCIAAVLDLFGVNGAGKSTSLRVIAGVLAPDSGKACASTAPICMTRRNGRGAASATCPSARRCTPNSPSPNTSASARRLRGLDQRAACRGGARDRALRLGEVRHRLVGQLSGASSSAWARPQALLHAPSRWCWTNRPRALIRYRPCACASWCAACASNRA